MKGASFQSVALFGVLITANLALAISHGNYNTTGFYWYCVTLFALVLLFAINVSPLKSWKRAGRIDARLFQMLLAGMFVAVCRFQVDQNTFMYAEQPTWGAYLKWTTRLATVLGLIPLGLAAISFAKTLNQRWIRLSLALVLPPILYLYVLAPIASPEPWIDVWYLQMEGVETLIFRGRNPYAWEYTNIYGNTPWYPSGKADFYPYPPLSLVVAAIGYLDGDIRRALIFCHVGAALLLFLTARKRGVALVESATLGFLFLYLPYGPFISEQAWTEPSLAFGFGLFSWFLASSRPMAALWAAGFAIALKQTMIFVPPLLWALWRKFELRHWVALFTISAVSYGAFALWDPYALYDDVVRFHSLVPFRGDGLTLSAFLVHRGGHAHPTWWMWAGLAIAAAITSFFIRKKAAADPEFQPDRIHLFFLGSALTFLLVLLLGKQAFLNYFYLFHYFAISALLWSRISDQQGGPAPETAFAAVPVPVENSVDDPLAEVPFQNASEMDRTPVLSAEAR